MTNKITEYLSSVAGKEVTNIDLINTIRSQASDAYQQAVPFIDAKQVSHATVPTQQIELHNEEFLDVLVKRIATTVIKALSFSDPFAVFKKENFEYGEVVQEIFTYLSDGMDYDGNGSDSPFQKFDINVETAYHKNLIERIYPASINKIWVSKAFVSDFAFNEFVNGIFKAVQSRSEFEEYQNVKSALVSAMEPLTWTRAGSPVNATIPYTEIDTSLDGYVDTFNEELLNTAKQFLFPAETESDMQNIAKVPNSTNKDDIYLIVDTRYSTKVDLMLANAFNMQKAAVNAKVILVDKFDTFTGSGQLNGKKPVAFLLSKDALILNERLNQMTYIWDPRHLKYNVFYHHHYLTSVSPFENIHVFVEK